MKTGFHDPIEPKIKSKKLKSPWDYTAPPYDERSSCFVNTGTNYGVCHRQPVGREGNPHTKVSTLPFGRVHTMRVDETSPKIHESDFHE